MEALSVLRKHLASHQKYFPEAVPIEGVVTPSWTQKVLEQVDGNTKVNRQYHELCVLQRLERALKCKEVWVEGSYAFRSPDKDLPGDWGDEQKRVLHYQNLGKPLDAQAFVRSLQQRLAIALQEIQPSSSPAETSPHLSPQ